MQENYVEKDKEIRDRATAEEMRKNEEKQRKSWEKHQNGDLVKKIQGKRVDKPYLKGKGGESMWWIFYGSQLTERKRAWGRNKD